MNLPWDKYEYSEPFLIQSGMYSARYFMWRRNLRTGQYTLKGAGLQSVSNLHERHIAPDPLTMFPPLVNKATR